MPTSDARGAERYEIRVTGHLAHRWADRTNDPADTHSSRVSGPAAALALPVAAWEFSLGVWLTVKGLHRDGADLAERPIRPDPLTSSPVETRVLGRTRRPVSVVGLGTWQLGADWGDVDEATALGVLEAAASAGVTLFDTADVYGDGRSEQTIGRFLRDNPGSQIFVATKMGRRVEQVPENYVLDHFRAWTDRSRKNLGVDKLDLVQLHCPPSSVYFSDEMFDSLDTLVAEDRVAAYGVSVETVAEALAAIDRQGVASVQIILNAFRQKPLEHVLPAAINAGVGILARVPLASGLLSGRYTTETTFAPDDHRSYNRDGSAFDVGETFSGVDFATGVSAATEFSALARHGVTPAQLALRWIVDQPGVTAVIPGARSPEQARGNAAAADVAPLDDAQRTAIGELYDRRIRPLVHSRW